MIKAAVIFLNLLLTSVSYGQQFFISLHGLVTDHFTALPLKDVLVHVDVDGKRSMDVVTNADGNYRFSLNKGPLYAVSYSKTGYVTKRVSIDSRKVPDYPDVPFYDMDVQMVLFESIPNFDFSLFNQPIGEAQYKHSVRTMNWDNAYSEERQRKVAAVMREYNKTYRGYYERTTVKPPIVIADSVMVLAADSAKDVAIVGEIMDRFQPADSATSYYDDPLAAPAQQVEKMRGLFFTVQVGVYSKPTALDRIYNITPLNSELMEDGHIRYTSGQFEDMKAAGEYRKKMVDLGVRDAFVIAYFNGKRIPLEDALYLSAKFGKAISVR